MIPEEHYKAIVDEFVSRYTKEEYVSLEVKSVNIWIYIIHKATPRVVCYIHGYGFKWNGKIQVEEKFYTPITTLNLDKMSNMLRGVMNEA